MKIYFTFLSDKADMMPVLKIIKGHNSVKIAVGIAIFNLCALSCHGLNVYQFLRKYFKVFQSY